MARSTSHHRTDPRIIMAPYARGFASQEPGVSGVYTVHVSKEKPQRGVIALILDVAVTGFIWSFLVVAVIFALCF